MDTYHSNITTFTNPETNTINKTKSTPNIDDTNKAQNWNSHKKKKQKQIKPIP